MTSSSSVPARGHIILRSHAPLPRFACAIPVPPPSSLVLQLRSTIVAILIGQVSAGRGDRTENAYSAAVAAAATKKAASTGVGLSYSEHLKQQTVHEWRLNSIVLELCQNAFIAPETRELIGNSATGPGEDSRRRASGFLLLDEHDCALLEDGDEVNVWLKEGQDVDSLRLPILPPRHVYGLPNQPSLTRSGTLVGPPPPSYSERDRNYDDLPVPSLPSIVEPAEPSSYSSSVSAHPSVQYETTMRHMPAPTGGHRVLVLHSQTNAVGAAAPLGSPNTNLSAPAKTGKRSKPKKIMSEGSNALVDQLPRAAPERSNSSSYFTPHANGGQARVEAARSPVQSPPTSPTLTTPSNKDIIAASQNLQAGTTGGASRVERQDREKVRKAGQRAMPSQALIIGHGVQGKVGRVSSTDGKTTGSYEHSTTGGGGGVVSATEIINGDYGNMEAFVSFTAASSEVQQMKQQQNGAGTRRASNRSGTSDKDKIAGNTSVYGSGSKSAGIAILSAMAESTPSNAVEQKKEKTKPAPPVKRYVKLPEKPEIPPIRNLVPFESNDEPMTEVLMAMPVASSIGTMPDATLTPSTTKSQREIQLEEDAALARALSESLNGPFHANNSGGSDGFEESSHRSVGSERKNSGNMSQVKSGALRRRPTPAGTPSISMSQGGGGSGTPVLTPPSTHATPLLGWSPTIARRSSESPSQLREESSLLPSKAERRYQEVKKGLEAEKERQAEQERVRCERARKASEERVKTLQALEQERRQRETRERWQVWEEVRARQAKEEAQK